MPAPIAKPGSTPAARPAAGLSAEERAHFARGLLDADLAHARAQAQALKQEAAAEHDPHRAALATDRLALIDAEARQRARLEGRLTSGETAATYAQGLASRSDAELAQLQASLPRGNHLERLAVTREQSRRAGAAERAAAAQEQTRLAGVKAQYDRFLAGKAPGAIRTETKQEQARLAQAKAALEAANAALAGAAPADQPAAEAAVRAAAKALRTEYARQAVLQARQPPTWDHAAMHAYADSLKKLDLPALQAERARLAAEYENLSTGAIRGSKQEVTDARVKLAIADAAIARAGKVPGKSADPTRNPGNKVFEGPGMFVADASSYPAGVYAARLKAAGITWISLQVNNPGPVDGNLAALQSGWADAWRAQGFKVGFWGVSYGDAANDARTAAQLTAQYKGDFYIADCEGSFQAGEGDPARNAAYAANFQTEASRLGIGNLPRALSSMGRVALDMKPWIDGGWDAMPQAYWNSHAVYQPSLCVKFYEDWGWPRDRLHPTIATYDATGEHGDVPGGKQVKDYVADLRASGTTGISYYLPEAYLDDAEYQQLKDGLAGGMNGPA